MSKAQNVKELFKDGKTRNVILLTGVIVAIVMVVVIFSYNKKAAAPLPAEVRGASLVQSTPDQTRQMGEMDPKYREMFDNQNQIQAAQAEKTGTSAFARIADDPKPVNRMVPETKPAPAPAQANRNPPAPKPPAPHPAVLELLNSRWQPTVQVIHSSHAPVVLDEARVEVINEGATGTGGYSNQDDKPAVKTYYNAGDIAAATLINTLNSDAPGPVVAVLQSGPLAGSRLLGGAQSGPNGVGVIAQFNLLATKSGETYPINAQAMSEGELATTLASHTDYKTLNRFVFRPLAYFAKGFADAVMVNATTSSRSVDNTGLTTITDNKLTAAEQVRAAVGMAAGELVKETDRPEVIRPTTIVERNEVFGVLFMQRVDDSMKQ